MNKNALRLIAELHKEIQAYKVAGDFEDAKEFKNPNMVDAESDLSGESSKKAYLNEILKEIEYNQIRVSSLGRKVAYLKVGSSK